MLPLLGEMLAKARGRSSARWLVLALSRSEVSLRIIPVVVNIAQSWEKHRIIDSNGRRSGRRHNLSFTKVQNIRCTMIEEFS